MSEGGYLPGWGQPRKRVRRQNGGTASAAMKDFREAASEEGKRS